MNSINDYKIQNKKQDRIIVKVSPELMRRIKVKCALKSTTMQAEITRVFEFYFPPVPIPVKLAENDSEVPKNDQMA